MKSWKGGNSLNSITFTVQFLFNIVVVFEKYETLKQKVGRGLRGSGPHSERSQELLDFEI